MDKNQQKFGRYTLLGRLARGGMGEVYLASLSGVAGFEKRCVIKKIRPDLASDSSFVERFLNEGRTLVALTHSNIVQIFDMGVSNGEYYLAMEYVSGADLRFLLKAMNHSIHIPVDVAAAVVLEVLKGLDYAHHATDNDGKPLMIVHRDISPSNILISDQGEVKLIDFGIAKARTIESISGIVQGKFAYMSPEQARGESLDQRTDIFSLGIVFYEMLSGIRPFEGGSDLQSLERVKTEQYRSVTQFNPDVDEMLDGILRKSLEKNREDRFQTAEEFYDALDSYAREHHLTAGMREIALFFKPWLSSESPVPEKHDVIEAELDAMLMAQNKDNDNRTKTLLPTSSDSHPSIDPHIKKYRSQNGKLRVIDRTAFENVDVEAGTEDMPALSEQEIQEVSAFDSTQIAPAASSKTNSNIEINNSLEQEIQKSSAISEKNTDSELLDVLDNSKKSELQNHQSSQKSKQKVFLFKIRYLILGAISACVFFLIIWLLLWHVRALDKDNDVPEGIADKSYDVKMNGEQSAAVSLDEEHIVSTTASVSGLTEMTKRGLPLLVTTDPENATIYIVEGAYRSLKDKSVVLLPGANAEIAIQAPGYETCLFHVYLDNIGTPGMRSTDWDNCKSITSTFSAGSKFIELMVSLNKMVPGSRKDLEEMPQEQVAEQQKSADNPDLNHQKNETVAAQPSVEIQPKSEKQKPETPKNTKHNTIKTVESHQSSISSNIPAEIIYQNERCASPCKLNIREGDDIKIMPTVTGRKIAIPKTLHNPDSAVNIDFCEANIRIQESYVAGDPAPYQIADIFVDKTIYARQTDMASFVMPCGKHTISAQIKTQGALLSATVPVDLSPGKPYSTSLLLK